MPIEIAADLIAMISAAGIMIVTLEDLVRYPIFHEDGVLSWKVLQLANHSTLASPFWRFMSRLYDVRAFKAMLRLRLCTAGLLEIAVIARVDDVFKGVLLFFSLLFTLLISLRSLYGLDGAHQMNLVVCLGLTLFYIATPGSLAQRLCIAFVGAECITSYVVSGVYKMYGRSWRNGTAISGIMSAKLYGHEKLGRYLRDKSKVCVLLCWGIIVFESLFVVTALGESWMLYGVLTAGVLFHAINAVFMGLNNFFFAFVSGYPAIVYLNGQLRDWLF